MKTFGLSVGNTGTIMKTTNGGIDWRIIETGFKNLEAGKYTYRLKQIDLDGKFEYSKEILIVITIPAEYTLLQNYPNPFNPSTKISYSLKMKGM